MNKHPVPNNIAELGKKTRFNSEKAAECAKKSVEARAKRKVFRQTVREMLASVPKMSEGQLESLKKMGIENESPNVQMLIIAQVINLALKGDLNAVQMLASFAGEDATSIQLDAKLQVEREKIRAMEHTSASAVLPVVVRCADGAIEVREQ